ncbi:CpsD/CapB family tyrosine-protein kinase [Caulobacter sp. 17J65-9]|uniref:CpsD/CapB family tyrosine-protein kinase n=1 Tax=Caulobacter sp. 17J65-9 TaxID=2709382 RepID=UPI0013CC618E|nr:CpsD/CapB family tyrosine-protein kinase [Caulobacter sp. 17J65-9]NEX91556.1 CpsD/CapB family tyrosine-protein kinase [Caulobacter sp. 17J65-9]
MVDLTAEMAALWAALARVRGAGADGRVIQFVAARQGEGTSTVAREFARMAAVRARRPVWLVDADLENPSQLDAVCAEPERFGRVGPPASATPDQSIFYAVRPPIRSRNGVPVADRRLTVARSALGGRLWVSRFSIELVPPGRRAKVLSDGAYWSALRRHADTVVIDCPAGDRAETAEVLAPVVDATVLVVAADDTDAREASALKTRIEEAGGRCIGLVFNRAQVQTPKFLRRFAG